MTLRQALLSAIGESCAVALPSTTQHRSFCPDPKVAELLAAAMRACDHWGDGPQAREEMRLSCIDTPANQHDDLLEHFRRSYPAP